MAGALWGVDSKAKFALKTAALVVIFGIVGFCAGFWLADSAWRSAGPAVGFFCALAIPLGTGVGVAVGFYASRRLWW